MNAKKHTSGVGNLYSDQQDTQTAGLRGPVLQDFVLQENLAHMVREQIPERVVYAKGSGAYGKFTVTHDISRYTRAALFSKTGNSCRVFARFSLMGGENGSADTSRNPFGFALKFYTEDGNWDLVGSNTPVFFLKDATKFPDFIHSQKRVPKTNLKSATLMWDFWSLNPESLHQVMMLMSDRGTPYGYRHMHGFASHTFSMINADHERVWIKFHFKTKQGIKNFTPEEATRMAGDNPDFAQEDLCTAIEGGDYPKWILFLQVMTEEQSKDFRWNPFDVTKVWLQSEFPLIEVGELELNEIPSHYFHHVEQAAFSPGHIINGINLSPDSMLQGRVFSYPDAHRYRLGVNAGQLEVNRCPFDAQNSSREGAMENFEHYSPHTDRNRLDEKSTGQAFIQNENEDDHYTQPGLLYTKAMNLQERKNMVRNIVGSLKKVEGPKREEIISRQICHFFRANIELGMSIAHGLQFNIDANMLNHGKI